jgi:hypothetical protein
MIEVNHEKVDVFFFGEDTSHLILANEGKYHITLKAFDSFKEGSLIRGSLKIQFVFQGEYQ